MQWDNVIIQILNAAISTAFSTAFAWFLGTWLEKRIFQRMEEQRQFGQIILEQRLKIYHETAPLLNDLLCFCSRVGHWKDLNPPKILENKRQLDRTMHIARPLFSDAFFLEYQHFIALCFEMFTGVGKSAKLRCKLEKYRNVLTNWQDETWSPMFSADDEASKSENILIAYEKLMSLFASELGLRRLKE